MSTAHQFTFSPQLTEPPADAQLRLNAVSLYEATTKVWASYLTEDALDVFYLLKDVEVGSTLYVQDKNNHTQYVKFTTTGPAIDRGGYAELPVAWQSGGGIPLANNQAVAMLVIAPANLEPAPEPEPEPPASAGADDFFHVVITTPLVAMATVKDHLRITDAYHDADISSKLLQAQNLILDYLKHGADPNWTEATLPYPVQAAILELLAHAYEDRASSDFDPDADEKVWASIDRKLARFRDPAMA